MEERRGLTARSMSSRREKEVGGRPLAGRQIFGTVCTLMRPVGWNSMPRRDNYTTTFLLGFREGYFATRMPTRET